MSVSGAPFTFFSSKNTETKQLVEKITSWIRNELKTITVIDKLTNIEDDYTIMVTEVQCNDPNCVPIETLVILIGKDGDKYSNKIMKPLNEVMENDVKEILLLWELFRIAGSNNHNEKEDDSLNHVLSETESMISTHMMNFSNQESKFTFICKLEEFLADEKRKLGNSNSLNAYTNDSNDNNSDDMSIPALDEPETTSIVTTHLESTFVQMKPISSSSSISSSKPSIPTVLPSIKVVVSGVPPIRHEKGSRGPRGCPCCDPDNIENITDRMLFLDCPP